MILETPAKIEVVRGKNVSDISDSDSDWNPIDEQVKSSWLHRHGSKKYKKIVYGLSQENVNNLEVSIFLIIIVLI